MISIYKLQNFSPYCLIKQLNKILGIRNFGCLMTWSLRHFQPWDNFHREKFAAQTFSAARHFQPWGWKTLSALRHFQLRQFQPWDTCGSEKLSAGRHFQPWDTCGFEKLSAGRNFQSGETFSPENSWETLSAPRQFRPRETFSLKTFSASRNFKPFFLNSLSIFVIKYDKNIIMSFSYKAGKQF